MSNIGKRMNLGTIIVGALFVAIGFYMIFYQEGYYYQKLDPFRDAGIVVFIVDALFLWLDSFFQHFKKRRELKLF